MKRRLLLTAPLALGATACAALPAGARHKVPASQLQQALARRFPLRYPVAGLVDLQVKAPQLRLFPERNRLGSLVELEAAGPALRRSYAGAFELEFGLRYEPSDRSVRAHQLQVHSLRLPGLPASTAQLLESALPALAREAMAEVVLYRLEARELALADTMGLRPDTITVTTDGLEIGLAPNRS